VRTVALAPGPHGGGLGVPLLGWRLIGERPLAAGTLRRLRREAAGAAVVVAHGSWTLPACAFAFAGMRIPLVYRSISDPAQWGTTTARRVRVRAYLRRAHAVVALTTGSAAMIQSMYGVPGDRVTVIPTGVSPEQHLPAGAAARRAARKQFGIPEDADVGVVLGALSPEKDVGLAIDAAAALPRIHLVIAGDGPEREALEERAARVAPGRVHFVGSVRDPAPVFAAADLVLLTSRTEGLPAVLIEAGMRELPAVATDVGFVREIVADGETGVLIEPRSQSELVSAITGVLRDGSHLGTNARRCYLAQFELSRVVDRWEVLLNKLRSESAVSPGCRDASDSPTLASAGVTKATVAAEAGPKEQ
jgi:glycosyltransferase involved in cell wall biosynthesis